MGRLAMELVQSFNTIYKKTSLHLHRVHQITLSFLSQNLQRKRKRGKSHRPRFCMKILQIRWPVRMVVRPTWRSPPGMWTVCVHGSKRKDLMWEFNIRDIDRVLHGPSWTVWPVSVSLFSICVWVCVRLVEVWTLYGFLCFLSVCSGCVRRIQTCCVCRRLSVLRKPCLLRSLTCPSILTSTGLDQRIRRVTAESPCSAKLNRSMSPMVLVSVFFHICRFQDSMAHVNCIISIFATAVSLFRF